MKSRECCSDEAGKPLIPTLFQTVVNYTRLASLAVFPGKVSILKTVVLFVQDGLERGDSLALELCSWCLNELRAPNPIYVKQSGVWAENAIALLQQHGVVDGRRINSRACPTVLLVDRLGSSSHRWSIPR